jgi:FkbM family methyltransferase
VRTLRLKTLVDAGANRGQFSLLFRHLFPEGRIYAFEPQKKAGDIYERIFGRDDKCRLFRCALGAKREMVQMHLSSYDRSSSLLSMRPVHLAWAPHARPAGTEEVEVARLDELLSEQDIAPDAMLKIDVQGYEMPVIEGAGQLLEKFKYVFCEVSFVELYDSQDLADTVTRALFQRGFRLKCVSQVGSFNKEPLQADILFAR